MWSLRAWPLTGSARTSHSHGLVCPRPEGPLKFCWRPGDDVRVLVEGPAWWRNSPSCLWLTDTCHTPWHVKIDGPGSTPERWSIAFLKRVAAGAAGRRQTVHKFGWKVSCPAHRSVSCPGRPACGSEIPLRWGWRSPKLRLLKESFCGLAIKSMLTMPTPRLPHRRAPAQIQTQSYS